MRSTECGKRRRLRWRGHRFSQANSQVADVMPAPELEADIFVDTDRLESHRFMEADAGGVRHNNFGEGRPETLLSERVQQRTIESTSDSSAVRSSIQIDRRIHGPAISR